MPLQGLRQFTRAVRSVTERMPAEAASKVQRGVAFNLIEGIVQYTPVDTGRAKGNWQVTVDVPAEGETGRADKAGGATIAEGQRMILGAPPFSVVWIANNVPYIVPLEQGHSPQAGPGAMVAAHLAAVMASLRTFK